MLLSTGSLLPPPRYRIWPHQLQAGVNATAQLERVSSLHLPR